MTKFFCIDIYWVSLSLDPHRTRQQPHFPNRPEYFPDDPIYFPVKPQEIPCLDAQGISEYRLEIAELFGAFAWAENTQRAKFPVFSQLAGNLPAFPMPEPGRTDGNPSNESCWVTGGFIGSAVCGCLSADSPVLSGVIGRTGRHGRSGALPWRKQRGHPRGNGAR